MNIVNVLVAAGAAWLFGAAWYIPLYPRWMVAAGVKAGPDGGPEGGASAIQFLVAALAMLMVSAMMGYLFSVASITSVTQGASIGLGIGLFIISPWIMMDNVYAKRPLALTLIDGGYAVFGCAIIGTLLVAL